ncbi:MAG TPA: hypothetical protein DDX71_06365 [Ruminococcus sp.]|nr:hypothetical protein [Ruminococcus sp.]
MLKSKVTQVFLLFSMLPDAGGWEELIDGALCRVEQLLRDDADADDIRLCWLAAADAHLQYRRILAANAVQPGYAGNSGMLRDGRAAVDLAVKLRDAYYQECAPLLRDDAFAFFHVP